MPHYRAKLSYADLSKLTYWNLRIKFTKITFSDINDCKKKTSTCATGLLSDAET